MTLLTAKTRSFDGAVKYVRVCCRDWTRRQTRRSDASIHININLTGRVGSLEKLSSSAARDGCANGKGSKLCLRSHISHLFPSVFLLSYCCKLLLLLLLFIQLFSTKFAQYFKTMIWKEELNHVHKQLPGYTSSAEINDYISISLAKILRSQLNEY